MYGYEENTTEGDQQGNIDYLMGDNFFYCCRKIYNIISNDNFTKWGELRIGLEKIGGEKGLDGLNFWDTVSREYLCWISEYDL